LKVDSINSLKEISRADSLELIDLGDDALALLPRVKGLKSLSAAGCSRITDGGVVANIPFLNLKVLDLSECVLLGDASAIAIAGITSLEELLLWNCNLITSSGVCEIAKLSRLRSLYLDYCERVDDDGFTCLGRCVTLEELHLFGCNLLSERGATSIFELPRLRSIALPEFSSLDNSAFKELSRLPKALEELEMYMAPITDEALESFAQIKSLKTLKLSVRPRFSDAAIADFHRRLPSCALYIENELA
jgi:hypothetical protein